MLVEERIAPAAAKLTGATATSGTDVLWVDYTSPFLVGEDFPPVGTVDDVANYLRLTSNATRALCRTGQLRAIKCGNMWRIPRAYLQDFIERGGCHE